MTVINLETHFIEQQIVNNRLKLSTTEIQNRVIAELESHVKDVMKKSGNKLKGFHIQLYTTDEVYTSNDFRFLPNANPLGDAQDYYEDDE